MDEFLINNFGDLMGLFVALGLSSKLLLIITARKIQEHNPLRCPSCNEILVFESNRERDPWRCPEEERYWRLEEILAARQNHRIGE